MSAGTLAVFHNTRCRNEKLSSMLLYKITSLTILLKLTEIVCAIVVDAHSRNNVCSTCVCSYCQYRGIRSRQSYSVSRRQWKNILSVRDGSSSLAQHNTEYLTICSAIELLFLVGFAGTQVTVRPTGFCVTEVDGT
jgi:hypothetical protein